MATFITDPALEQQLLAQRRATGADRYDEVWNGVHMMAPMPNDEHQRLVAVLTGILFEIVQLPGLGEVRPGINVSNRDEDWTHDYRVPDVAVCLPGGRAQNRDTHWLGGPDLVFEIVSPEDRTRDKIEFYGQAGVRELIIIDRNPWQIELYRLSAETLALTVIADTDNPALIQLTTVPLTLSLQPAQPRPQITVTHPPSGKSWLM